MPDALPPPNPALGTDKMLSRKEGGVGWMIFNNPERHNAVSMEMWEAAEKILADFAGDSAENVMDSPLGPVG